MLLTSANARRVKHHSLNREELIKRVQYWAGEKLGLKIPQSFFKSYDNFKLGQAMHQAMGGRDHEIFQDFKSPRLPF